MSVESDLLSGKAADNVYALLDKYPQVRDNDKLLWLAYCVYYRGLRDHMSLEQYSAFKTWLLNSKTPMFESLSRARRKIQETTPRLRGEGYVERKESADNISEWARGQ